MPKTYAEGILFERRWQQGSSVMQEENPFLNALGRIKQLRDECG